jgi:hypothetical protein
MRKNGGSTTMKKRLDIRIAGHLRDGIDVVTARSGHTLTQVVERYIAEGLARDNGELVESSTLPLIAETVRIEVAKAMAELYQQLSTDLQKSARRSDDRLAALIVKTARYAGIGQRMIHALTSKMVGQDFAARAFEDAREKTGKDIASPQG